MRARVPVRYAVSIALSAFLLFQVQPLIAAFILPWFGGTNSVWTTCLLFFQTVLLGGYAYAHWIAQRPPRTQAIAHAVLLAVSLVLLPIVPSLEMRPDTPDFPVLHILWLLTATVGLPYFVLSANAPLVQKWFADAAPGRSPYRLYALSNVASFAGLLTYPVLVQPLLALTPQAWGWSGLYVVFAAACVVCLVPLFRQPNGPVVAGPDTGTEETVPPPTGRQTLRWVFYAAVGVALMLAVTNRVTHDIASVPFLWVLPLAIYLLTFVVAFDRPTWYRRTTWIAVFAVYLFLDSVWFQLFYTLPLGLRLFVEAGLVWSGCLVCHGELASSKPTPRYLTRFYLTMSAGGAVGGLFVAVVAPLAFVYFWELPITQAAVLVLGLQALWRDPRSPLGQRRIAWSMTTLAFWLLVIGVALPSIVPLFERRVVRNFYGVLRVTDEVTKDGAPYRIIRHGDTGHGVQYLEPERRDEVAAYFSPGSGIGAAFRHLPQRAAGGRLDIGIIGLGGGSMAPYARFGDTITYYEINPVVEQLAREEFTFLEDSEAAAVDVLLGDARITMEREQDSGAARYDVLIVDAFNGGSVPMHLLTKECFAIYRSLLREDGVLMLHLSNTYLELERVGIGVAAGIGLDAVLLTDLRPLTGTMHPSVWVIAAKDEPLLQALRAEEIHAELENPPVVWTDQRSSLFPLVRWRQ